MNQEELAVKAQKGCADAADKIVAQYLPLCHKVAGKYRIAETDFEERVVMAQGFVWKAVVTYKIERGFKFSTWCMNVVFGCFMEHRRNALISLGITRLMQAGEHAMRPDLFSLNAMAEDLGIDMGEIGSLAADAGYADIDAEITMNAVLAGITDSRSREIGRYAFFGDDIQQVAIAKEMGVSASRVYQLRERFRDQARVLIAS